jgi:DNA (cytosine-5)-methyltransferase 1
MDMIKWRKQMNKKVLNLYAGIGGNRKLWTGVDVIAVEINPEIAKIYQDFFPEDKMVVGDAHQYLLEHYKEFDFIWSSPPCQTHSQIRYNIGFKANRVYDKVKAKYPDMDLYQEIILLMNWFNKTWIVENTIPYYEPLIKYQSIGGHVFWSNFHISDFNIGNRNHRDGTVESLQGRKTIDISDYDIKNKRQILRNCVEPELGKHIFNCAFRFEHKGIENWLGD